ncbi:hypothetical protein OS493_033109 [Desmophyllum pertusum]|uniref:Uncharacterized protein n=1 Tax=Desmophyllum pertusum TaxID=174260 RepID=A0A9W9YZ82_9CNID|nr:hypothetical protein OS493_033109 [Desmophyllum pertusum]
MRKEVLEELKQENKSPSKSDSMIKMIPGHDKAYVSLSGGIKAVDEDEMHKSYLRFESDDRDLQVAVRVISDSGLSGVRFYNRPKHEKDRHLLCHLNFRLPPLKRDLKQITFGNVSTI